MDADAAVRENEGLCHWAVRRVLGWDRLHPAYDDAVQVCRMALWQCARLWRQERGVPFVTYARRAMTNGLRRLGKSEERRGFARVGNQRRHVDVPEPASLDVVRVGDEVGGTALPGREPDPADSAERECERGRLHAAIGRLPDRHAVALTGRHLRGQTFTEVGRSLGVKAAHAWEIEARGRQLLRAELAD